MIDNPRYPCGCAIGDPHTGDCPHFGAYQSEEPEYCDMCGYNHPMSMNCLPEGHEDPDEPQFQDEWSNFA